VSNAKISQPHGPKDWREKFCLRRCSFVTSRPTFMLPERDQDCQGYKKRGGMLLTHASPPDPFEANDMPPTNDSMH